MENEICCYVKVKPVSNEFLRTRRITELYLGFLYEEFPVFINDKGDMQLKYFKQAIIKTNGKKRAHVVCMVRGKFLVTGIVTEWSRKPIKDQAEKLSDKCRNIINEIKRLQEQKRSLVCQGRKKN